MRVIFRIEEIWINISVKYTTDNQLQVIIIKNSETNILTFAMIACFLEQKVSDHMNIQNRFLSVNFCKCILTSATTKTIHAFSQITYKNSTKLKLIRNSYQNIYNIPSADSAFFLSPSVANSASDVYFHHLIDQWEFLWISDLLANIIRLWHRKSKIRKEHKIIESTCIILLQIINNCVLNF